MSTLQEKLIAIQRDLKAPKSQFNAFGKYRYRSCEDILEAVKPLLFREGVVLTIADDLLAENGRFYVKASATLSYQYERICSSAFAREDETKKGMDGSQITGAASSYARKYALNGLFCIDDTKDADATNTGEQQPVQEQQPAQEKKPAQDSLYAKAMLDLSLATTVEELRNVWSKYKTLQNNETFKKAKDIKKKTISEGL